MAKDNADTAKQQRKLDTNGEMKKPKWKKSYGCLIFLAVLLILTIIVNLANESEKEWRAARPKDLNEAEWAAKRSLCDNAGLAAIECGETPLGKVEELSRAAVVLKEEAAERRRKDKACPENARGDAIFQAKEIVKAALKSPSTADFVESSIRASQKDCLWTVTGEVDAQNTFGAQLRSDFRVELRRTADRQWLPMGVSVD